VYVYRVYNFIFHLQYGQEAVKKRLPGHTLWLRDHQEFFRQCCPPSVPELLLDQKTIFPKSSERPGTAG